MRPSTNGRLSGTVFLVAACCAAWAGCSGDSPRTVASAALDTVADTTIVPASVTSDALLSGALSSDDPFHAFLPDSLTIAPATELRKIPLWLTNTFPGEVVVQAEAGVGRVVVDTVAPGDSIRVDLETRADSVRVTAMTLAGRRVGERVVRPGRGLQRLVFP